MNDESVFLSLPSAGAIAQWFTEEHSAGRFQNPGGAATLLSDDPHCTVWLLAMVDHDDQEFYLLDIATTLDEVTSHDLLFVTAGLNEALACEWRMKPTATQPWSSDGLDWFAGRIEFWEEAAAAAPSTPAPTEETNDG